MTVKKTICMAVTAVSAGLFLVGLSVAGGHTPSSPMAL